MRNRLPKQVLVSVFVINLGIGFATQIGTSTSGVTVNDKHSGLNETRVDQILTPSSIDEIQKIIISAGSKGQNISIAGGRHAMGGQQFGEGTVLIDVSKMNRVISLDTEKGIIDVEAGIQWPELLEYLQSNQKGKENYWTFRQKQTGADKLSIGGSVSANAHGRGLKWKPLIQDIESLKLVDSTGELNNCSRAENPELFKLVIGGYGLFGVITSVKLRLTPRLKLQRDVQVINGDGLMKTFDGRIEDGYLYGDWQYSTDSNSPGFLERGVFSLYRPVNDSQPVPEVQKELKPDDWEMLYYLGHVDKAKAWEKYSGYYLTTTGQRYWSDTHQMTVYIEDYHKALDRKLKASVPGSEMISELYVPRDKFPDFMKNARDFLKVQNASVIYGTVRLIERDDESFLAWARDRFACIIFNLHVNDNDAGMEVAKKQFQGLIDIALSHNGSYFLTYHRWARKDQVLKAYPQFVEFLKLKNKYDPAEVFQSDWYRHYRKMFSSELASSNK